MVVFQVPGDRVRPGVQENVSQLQMSANRGAPGG